MVQYSTTTLSSSRVPDSMNSALPVVGCEAAAACLVKFWRQKLSLYSRVCTLVSVEREGDMALPEWWVSGTQWLGMDGGDGALIPALVAAYYRGMEGNSSGQLCFCDEEGELGWVRWEPTTNMGSVSR